MRAVFAHEWLLCGFDWLDICSHLRWSLMIFGYLLWSALIRPPSSWPERVWGLTRVFARESSLKTGSQSSFSSLLSHRDCRPHPHLLENGVTINIVISVTFVIVTVIVIVICDRHVAGVIQWGDHRQPWQAVGWLQDHLEWLREQVWWHQQETGNQEEIL